VPLHAVLADAGDELPGQGAINVHDQGTAIRKSNRNPGTFCGFGTCAGRTSRQTGYTSLFLMANKVAGEYGWTMGLVPQVTTGFLKALLARFTTQPSEG